MTNDKMKWYHYAVCLLGGAFFANFIPHFIQGVSGAPFPTPFANPPGKGLSSSYVNVLWAFFNLIISYLLLKKGSLSVHKRWSIRWTLIGFFIMSLLLNHGFKHLHQ